MVVWLNWDEVGIERVKSKFQQRLVPLEVHPGRGEQRPVEKGAAVGPVQIGSRIFSWDLGGPLEAQLKEEVWDFGLDSAGFRSRRG